jgi:hypothetical protein
MIPCSVTVVSTIRLNIQMYGIPLRHTLLMFFGIKSSPDLPQVFRDYITARAATRCAIRLVGDVNLTQSLASFETWRRANCLEYECNEGDYTMFGFKKGSGFYNSYKPFQAILR